MPDDAGRKGSYAALLRGRLAHLDQLGVANWAGGWFQLAPSLEQNLRRLQIGDDIIRTLNKRRLPGAQDIRELGDQSVRDGRTVGIMTSWAPSRLSSCGHDLYARLKLGTQPPQLDAGVTLALQRGRLYGVSMRAARITI